MWNEVQKYSSDFNTVVSSEAFFWFRSAASRLYLRVKYVHWLSDMIEACISEQILSRPPYYHVNTR